MNICQDVIKGNGNSKVFLINKHRINSGHEKKNTKVYDRAMHGHKYCYHISSVSCKCPGICVALFISISFLEKERQYVTSLLIITVLHN